MAGEINYRRRALLKTAAYAALLPGAALAANQGSTDQATQQVLGYNVTGSEKYPELKQYSTLFAQNDASLDRFWDKSQSGAGTTEYLGRLQEFYQEKTQAHGSGSLFLKAATTQAWVNQQFNYSTETHDAIASEFGPGVYVADKWATPDDVLKGKAKPDCVEYAAAKFAGLKSLGVPSEDLLLVLGKSTSDPAVFSSAQGARIFDRKSSQNPMNHAWVMVRDRDTGQWLSLSDMSKDKPVLSRVNTGNHEGKDFEIPVMAIDGNGKKMYFDSMNSPSPDGTRTFKEVPPTPVDNIGINVRPTAPAAPESAPKRTLKTAPAP
jgi:predicted transglutaminase-like cysteine proteinase